MSESTTPDGGEDQKKLVRRVAAMRGRECGSCRAPLCGHVLLFNVVTGSATDVRCPECMARDFGQPARAVVARLRAHVGRRESTRGAWEQLGRDEPNCALGGAGAPPVS